MELIAVLFMLGAGVALAVIVLAAASLTGRPSSGPGLLSREPGGATRQEALAASLLFHVARFGAGSDAEALRMVRREGGVAAPVTTGIDVTNWAGAFASAAPLPQRTALLETAVRLASAGGNVLSLAQYAALLDLSFGLGFQTDALARLRELYGFRYAESSGRPPVQSLYRRERSELLEMFGVDAKATRDEIAASYRKLAAVHHPDRFHGAPEAEQEAAAARFIELTEAYEALLRTRRD
jgi:hypothetical protein